MPRDNNIVVSIQGGNARGAFGGGTMYKNKNTLNSKQFEGETKMNLSKVLNVGLAFNTAQKANEIVGAYTNDRLRQREINVGLTFAKYGIGFAINPLAGGVYMASDLGYRSIMYGIGVQKKNREADYYKRLSGNNASSGSRYRGGYL